MVATAPIQFVIRLIPIILMLLDQAKFELLLQCRKNLLAKVSINGIFESPAGLLPMFRNPAQPWVLVALVPGAVRRFT